MSDDELYIVYVNGRGPGQRGNVCVTTDGQRAKEVRDDHVDSYDAFIEVWTVGSEEPEYVTRANPDDLDR